MPVGIVEGLYFARTGLITNVYLRADTYRISKKTGHDNKQLITKEQNITLAINLQLCR